MFGAELSLRCGCKCLAVAIFTPSFQNILGPGRRKRRHQETLCSGLKMIYFAAINCLNLESFRRLSKVGAWLIVEREKPAEIAFCKFSRATAVSPRSLYTTAALYQRSLSPLPIWSERSTCFKACFFCPSKA